MSILKSKTYWIVLLFVVIIGIFLILNVQNGFFFAYIVLTLFWIATFIVRKKFRRKVIRH